MSKLRSTLAEKCFTSETVVGGHRARELKIFVVRVARKMQLRREPTTVEIRGLSRHHAATPAFPCPILWKRPFVEIRYHFVLRFTFLFTNIAQKS